MRIIFSLIVALLLAGMTARAGGLDRMAAKAALDEAWKERAAELKTERAAEMEKKAITVENKTMRWEERVFGEAPAGGRSLWISMHGGGNGPAAMNDSQWKNQIGLYKPEEGIYVAPRAPTDTWNLSPRSQALLGNVPVGRSCTSRWAGCPRVGSRCAPPTDTPAVRSATSLLRAFPSGAWEREGCECRQLPPYAGRAGWRCSSVRPIWSRC